MLKDEISAGSSESEQLDIQSIDSDELEDDYQYAMQMKQAQNFESVDEDGHDVRQLKKNSKQRLIEADIDKINLDESEVQLIDKQRKFNQKFDSTYDMFSINIDFLNQ